MNFTNSLKRSISLCLMLLIAVCTQAQELQTFTVNTTSSSTTSTTGNKGSLMDAVKKVNSEGGSWKIIFDCKGDIVLNKAIAFSKLSTLQLVGNGKISLTQSETASYASKFFEFNTITKLSIDSIDFIGKKSCNFYAEQTQIGHLKGCKFNGVQLVFTRNVDSISGCNFINSRGIELAYEDMEHTIKVVENDTFTNCYRSFDHEFHTYDFWVNKMTGCVFYSENETDEYSNIIWGGYFKEIDKCKFYSNLDLNSGLLYLKKCDKLSNCEFNNSQYCIQRGEYELIDLVTFNNCSQCIVNTDITNIKNCTFNNCLDGISTNDVEKKLENVYNCTFTARWAAIRGQFSIKEIKKCTFKIIGNHPDYNLILTYNGTSPLLWENDFIREDNEYGFISLKGFEEEAPGIRRCRFLSDKDYYHAIENDPIPTPKITSVELLKSGNYLVRGTAGSEDVYFIEVFENEGHNKTATKYLTYNDSNEDGTFGISVPASEVTTLNFIVTATNGKGTSDLSNTFTYVAPTLTIKGEITKDNTCSSQDSQVNITVTGWSEDCTATLNGKSVKPSKTNGNTASFVFNNLEGGKHVFSAVNKKADINDSYEFELSSAEPMDLSNIKVDMSNSYEKCTGAGVAETFQIGYTGVKEGENVKFTLKNDTYEKSIETSSDAGNMLFYDVPVGEYEVTVEPAETECPGATKSLGKVAIEKRPKTRIDIGGLAIDDIVVNGVASKYFSLLIFNYKNRDEVTIYHDGVYLKSYVQLSDFDKETAKTPTDKVRFFYTDDCTADRGIYNWVFLDWGNAKSGHYKVEVKDKCDQIVEFEFDIDDCTPVDLSNIKVDMSNSYEKCTGAGLAETFQIGYTGVKEGENVKFTLKNDTYEKSIETSKGAGNMLFYNVPVGDYELTVAPAGAGCPGTAKSLGKVAIEKRPKTRMETAGLATDDIVVNGVASKYFVLEIFNYKNRDEVTIYHDGVYLKSYVQLSEFDQETSRTPTEKVRFFYTDECTADRGIYNWVFLDWGNAKSGHYKVEVKDKCDQIVEFEFDIDDCTPLDLSKLEVSAFGYRPQCAGQDNGQVQISYSGNVEGQTVKFTIKNANFTKSISTAWEAGNLLFHNVPSGTYEIFVSPEEAENEKDCPNSTKNLGKVTVDKTYKPSMSEPGLAKDESKDYFSLVINNYMNKDVVDVYRDGSLEARFTGATDGRRDAAVDSEPELYYTDGCGKDGNYFDFVFLDCYKAKNGHYLVEIKDQCNQTVVFEFDIDFETTGVNMITNDDELVDVYNVLGICLKRNVKRAEALDGLKRGVYIVGNERVIKSAVK